jgi:L-asparaginase
MQKKRKKVLLLHTGGTFGMRVESGSQEVKPTTAGYLGELLAHVPELTSIADLDLQILCNLDSSDMRSEQWRILAECICGRWSEFDGFVIIHGTDTMAYTSSALSFYMSNLTKPVVLTGSQRPLSVLRSDARANIIDAVELATLDIPEVCICFDSEVHRGTRVTKFSSEHMQAFRSYNSPVIGNFGVHFQVNREIAKSAVDSKVAPVLDCRAVDNIIALDCVPGQNISNEVIESIVSSVCGIVIRGFGSGNLPISKSSWIALCTRALERSIPVVMATQCGAGMVSLNAYENGRAFVDLGVISGSDMSFESLTVKLMVMLGRGVAFEQRHKFFAEPIAMECERGFSNG